MATVEQVLLTFSSPLKLSASDLGIQIHTDKVQVLHYLYDYTYMYIISILPNTLNTALKQRDFLHHLLETFQPLHAYCQHYPLGTQSVHVQHRGGGQ